jgi:nitronate monooxygenase
MRTWLTDRFELTAPIVGAPMAGVGGGRLAGAVSSAGALGMIGVGAATTGEWIIDQCALAAATGRPFGAGLMAWVLPERPEQLDATIEGGAALVSVSFGPYGDAVQRLQGAGVVVAGQVGTVTEARVGMEAGLDVLVVRGGEGGGHGRNDVATLPFLDAVLEIADRPVLAAGGISGPRAVAAVLAAGAEGAWVGTAFLGCLEADNSEEARRVLFAATEADTAYGRVFDVAQRLGWPAEYGGRAVRNTFFDRWSGHEDELAADDEAAAALDRARRAGNYDTAYLYAGQGVGKLRSARPAARVVAELAGAEGLLEDAARGVVQRPG